ncbi:replication initiator protein [Microviridae sp.]|nr:replication initiator protein [Microviridae sp.]
MACYKPLHGYRSKYLTKSGKRKIVFNKTDGYEDRPQSVKCGRCIGCRLDYSRQWAIRCLHEASLHPENAFITLTYDEGHMPHGQTLIKKHHQDFIKRLRKKISPTKITYYHCGEYGETTQRPHYHTLIFNYDWPDKVLYKQTESGPLYISPQLEKTWGKGFCTIGQVNFETAAYVARYIMKKITGEKAEEHYRRVDLDTGEEHTILPEYTTQSTRTPIGSRWLKKYKTDVYPHDYVIVNGRKMTPPRYYDEAFEKEEPEQYLKLKRTRLESSMRYYEDNQPERLAVRETVAKARIKERDTSV